MNREQMLNTYVTEARELLVELEDGVLALENNPSDPETLNLIFRAAHTIKGSGGIFGLDAIVNFSHHVENVLASMRDGDIAFNAELGDALLECRDHISTLVEEAAEGRTEPDEQIVQQGQALLEKLNQHANIKPPSVDTPTAANNDQTVATAGQWHLSVRFSPNIFMSGADPLRVLHGLEDVAETVCIEPVLDSLLQAGSAYDPEQCYLGFEIQLQGSALNHAAIRDVFEFVEDDVELQILAPASQFSDYIQLIESLPEDDLRLGEILVACGAITENDLKQSLASIKTPKIGQVLVDNQKTDPKLIEAALEKQSKVKRRQAANSQASIRVPADKLDYLISLIGELVSRSAAANAVAEQTGSTEMIESIGNLMPMIEAMRDATLELRMVEIGATFERFKRVVRDLGKELRKPVNLELVGGDTEMDKSVTESIGDPLTHLVRNAMDHGIESADVRKERGKPVQGNIRLQAYPQGGHIVIEIVDDGGGLNREKILRKAVEKGLIHQHDAETMSDADAYQLIFEPGFSTADQVSDVSGRGVGMDAVKRSIEKLRGSIDVSSILGEGSTFRITLPLTLAVIDGFMVRVADSSYILPLEQVKECVDFVPTRQRDKTQLVNLRGKSLPVLKLSDFYQLDTGNVTPVRESLVIIQAGNKRAGIVVDELLGEHQTVIKPLDPILKHVPGLTSTTILGSGEIALIIDPTEIIQSIEKVKDARSESSPAVDQRSVS
jgi:two-component system chemotaxis sensor kinase CheA